MDPDLEALIAADEDARARVEAAREAARARVAEAREDLQRRLEAQRVTRQRATDTAVAAIEEETSRSIADRRTARASYAEMRRLDADTRLAQAADLYAQIIKTGRAPGSEP
jgi:hypothetical protein